MPVVDFLFGRRLASDEQSGQKIGVLAGLPALGLDGLSSSAYGPEAALAILLPLGAVGLNYILPITGVILALLAMLYVSYRQTIAAYRAPCKGCWSPAGESPVREIVVAPGSNRDHRAGNQTVKALGGKGCFSSSASRQAVTTVNAEKASKTMMRKPTQR